MLCCSAVSATGCRGKCSYRITEQTNSHNQVATLLYFLSPHMLLHTNKALVMHGRDLPMKFRYNDKIMRISCQSYLQPLGRVLLHARFNCPLRCPGVFSCMCKCSDCVSNAFSARSSFTNLAQKSTYNFCTGGLQAAALTLDT